MYTPHISLHQDILPLTWRSRASECKFCETWYPLASPRCQLSSPWLHGAAARSIEAFPEKKKKRKKKGKKEEKKKKSWKIHRRPLCVQRRSQVEKRECNFLASPENSLLLPLPFLPPCTASKLTGFSPSYLPLRLTRGHFRLITGY